jgi:hypothetical protein
MGWPDRHPGPAGNYVGAPQEVGMVVGGRQGQKRQMGGDYGRGVIKTDVK